MRAPLQACATTLSLLPVNLSLEPVHDIDGSDDEDDRFARNRSCIVITYDRVILVRVTHVMVMIQIQMVTMMNMIRARHDDASDDNDNDGNRSIGSTMRYVSPM